MKPTDDLTEFQILWCVAVALSSIALVFSLFN